MEQKIEQTVNELLLITEEYSNCQAIGIDYPFDIKEEIRGILTDFLKNISVKVGESGKL